MEPLSAYRGPLIKNLKGDIFPKAFEGVYQAFLRFPCGGQKKDFGQKERVKKKSIPWALFQEKVHGKKKFSQRIFFQKHGNFFNFFA